MASVCTTEGFTGMVSDLHLDGEEWQKKHGQGI